MNTRLPSTAGLGVLALGLAASMLLSGCSLLPQIPVLGGGNSASDNGSGSSNEDDIENNPFLGHDVPEGFPADAPLPDLDIYYSLRTTEDSWSIIYKANDLESDYNSIAAAFEAAGWEVLLNNVAPDGSLGVFKKDPYQAQVMGVADGGNDYEGPILSFTVIASS